MTRRCLLLARIAISSLSVVAALGCRRADSREPLDVTTLAVDLSSAPRMELNEGQPVCGTGTAVICPISDVVAAAVEPGGRVVLANQRGLIVRFGTGGAEVDTIGGLGNGPGEYRAITALGIDSAGQLLAYDTRLRRLLTYDPEGRPVSTVNVVSPPPIVLGERIVQGGLWLFSVPPGESGREVNASLYLFHAATGTSARSAGVRMMPLTSNERSLSPIPPLFSPQPVWGVAADLTLLFSPGDSTVTMILPGGKKLRLLAAGDATPVTKADLDRAVTTLLTPRMPEPMREQFAAQVREARRMAPKSFPPITAILCGSDSSFWLRGPTPPTASMVSWYRFTTGGRLLGGLRLPASWALQLAVGDSLLITRPDSGGAVAAQWYGMRGS
ncbi:MAG: 6-bladed beta-propeller [Gemmatimonadales bacterium]